MLLLEEEKVLGAPALADIIQKESMVAISKLEEFLGWIMLALFILTLTKLMMRQ